MLHFNDRRIKRADEGTGTAYNRSVVEQMPSVNIFRGCDLDPWFDSWITLLIPHCSENGENLPSCSDWVWQYIWSSPRRLSMPNTTFGGFLHEPFVDLLTIKLHDFRLWFPPQSMHRINYKCFSKTKKSLFLILDDIVPYMVPYAILRSRSLIAETIKSGYQHSGGLRTFKSSG